MSKLPIMNHPPFPRRHFLRTSACGFGSVALAAMLNDERVAANPLAVRSPHFQPRAKHIIFLFMAGGPSQIDLFQHKPRLIKEHGGPIPFARPEGMTADGMQNSRLLRPVAEISRHGDSGMWWSELMPHTGALVDDICLLNGMHTNNPAHAPATLQVNTGYTQGEHPSMGAWVSYGLGTQNRNLPSFITINPIKGALGGPQLYGSAYLPAIHQGTGIHVSKQDPVPTIKYLNRSDLSIAAQREQLAIVETMNNNLLARTKVDSQLEGMIESMELAFRMQTEAPGLMDLAGESQATERMYGIDDKESATLGQQCLLARRFVEAGVRFIQIADEGWDHHNSIREGLPIRCRRSDKPIAGLMADLKMRGLLDETLIIWTGEFGRTSYDQDISLGKDGPEKYGRGHNHLGYSAWLAGGGVQGGLTHGQTDEYGFRAVDGKVHLHDLHATMLHLLGLDHKHLNYRHKGRDFRLTDVEGHVVREIFA